MVKAALVRILLCVYINHLKHTYLDAFVFLYPNNRENHGESESALLAACGVASAAAYRAPRRSAAACVRVDSFI